MTKEVVRDTMMFRRPGASPNSDLTITLDGWEAVEVENYKERLLERGFDLVGHDKDIVERSDVTLEELQSLRTFKLFLAGFLLGLIASTVFQIWITAGG